jgi:hypothetical protein
LKFKQCALYCLAPRSNLERFSGAYKPKVENSEYDKTSAGLEAIAFRLFPYSIGFYMEIVEFSGIEKSTRNIGRKTSAVSILKHRILLALFRACCDMLSTT